MSSSDSPPRNGYVSEKQALEAPAYHPAAEHIDLNKIDTVSAVRHDDVDAELDPRAVAKLTHKFDRRILPWLFGLWLLAFIGTISSIPINRPRTRLD